MELLIENGFEGFADVLRIMLNEAMKIEREQALGAQLYERTQARRGYANGYKPKPVGTRVGKLCVDVPQVRGDVDFYPSARERGCRSERALKLERLHEEIKRRTRVARLFPNEASLLRLVSAIEMEISEDWVAGKRYLDMNVEMESENESADSKAKRIYRKNVA